jgi:proline racemase
VHAPARLALVDPGMEVKARAQKSCGSCFPALMGLLRATRKLRLDEWVEVENLLGRSYRGRLVDRGGDLVPHVSGSAFITGEHRFRIDSRDPLRLGFQLA